jgi:hypothetical protein
MSGRGSDRLRIFDKLEQSIERLVEGPVGRVFVSKVQPAEIGRRLERAMTVNQAIALDGILAPNHFVIRIHPDDLAVFGDYADGLCTEYEDWLVAIAGDRDYRFVGEVSVRFLGDPGAPRRSPRVTAALVEQGPAPEIAQATGPAATGPLRYALAISDATYGTRRVPLAPGPNVVGRAPSCDIVIEDPSVSRVHARIQIEGGRIDLVDLGSTNGTRVDGLPVVSAHLEAGSMVTFGAVDAELAVDRAAGGRR